MPHAQGHLFDTPAVPGLSYVAALIGEDEERALIETIDAAPLAPFRFQGWVGKRLTAAFGWRYDHEDASFQRTMPMPGAIMPLRQRAARFAGLAPDDLVHALFTRYDPGAGIGWHRDRPVFEHVVGISLGAPAVLRFRRRDGPRFERAVLPLAPRSAYHLSGYARHVWEHSIAPGTATRWSITFRTLARQG